MSLLALLLVAFSSVVHASWNRAVHGVQDRIAVMAVGSLAAGVLLTPTLLEVVPVRVWALVLASGVVQAAYSALLVTAYSRGSLGVTYPVGRGSAPVLVTLAGIVVLRQTPSPVAAAGALAVALGIAAVVRSAHQRGQLAAVGWALAVGASIATYTVIDARAVTTGPDPWLAPAYLAAQMLVQGLLLTGWVAGSTARRSAGSARAAVARLRASTRAGLVVGAGMAVAYGAVLLAFRQAPAGRVATLRESSVLVAVALSADRRRPAVWLGAGLVVLGAVAAAAPA